MALQKKLNQLLDQETRKAFQAGLEIDYAEAFGPADDKLAVNKTIDAAYQRAKVMWRTPGLPAPLQPDPKVDWLTTDELQAASALGLTSTEYAARKRRRQELLGAKDGWVRLTGVDREGRVRCETLPAGQLSAIEYARLLSFELSPDCATWRTIAEGDQVPTALRMVLDSMFLASKPEGVRAAKPKFDRSTAWGEHHGQLMTDAEGDKWQWDESERRWELVCHRLEGDWVSCPQCGVVMQHQPGCHIPLPMPAPRPVGETVEAKSMTRMSPGTRELFEADLGLPREARWMLSGPQLAFAWVERCAREGVAPIYAHPTSGHRVEVTVQMPRDKAALDDAATLVRAWREPKPAGWVAAGTLVEPEPEPHTSCIAPGTIVEIGQKTYPIKARWEQAIFVEIEEVEQACSSCGGVGRHEPICAIMWADGWRSTTGASWTRTPPARCVKGSVGPAGQPGSVGQQGPSPEASGSWGRSMDKFYGPIPLTPAKKVVPDNEPKRVHKPFPAGGLRTSWRPNI